MFDASDVHAYAAQLDAVADRADRILEGVRDEAAARIAEEMRRAAPRRSGQLAASIRHAGGGVIEVAAHGVFQEYGTARHGPRPFARPAVQSAGDAVGRAVGEAAADALRR